MSRPKEYPKECTCEECGETFIKLTHHENKVKRCPSCRLAQQTSTKIYPCPECKEMTEGKRANGLCKSCKAKAHAANVAKAMRVRKERKAAAREGKVRPVAAIDDTSRTKSQAKLMRYEIVEDPSDAPLPAGMRLSATEYHTMLNMHKVDRCFSGLVVLDRLKFREVTF